MSAGAFPCLRQLPHTVCIDMRVQQRLQHDEAGGWKHLSVSSLSSWTDAKWLSSLSLHPPVWSCMAVHFPPLMSQTSRSCTWVRDPSLTWTGRPPLAWLRTNGLRAAGANSSPQPLHTWLKTAAARAQSREQRWKATKATPGTLQHSARPRNTVHESCEQTGWQRAALAASGCPPV